MSTPPGELVAAFERFKQAAQQPHKVEDSTVARNVDVLFNFDGGTSAISVGAHCYAVIDFPARVSGWFAVGDPIGSIVWDLAIGAFTDFPTLLDMVGAGAAPAIAAASSGSGELPLTGWTLDVPKNTVIAATVSSNDTLNVATLALRAKRLDLF